MKHAVTVLLKFEKCYNSRQGYTIWKLNTDIQTKNMNCEDLVKCMKKTPVMILIEWIKIYLFCKKDESEIIVFCSV